MPEELSSYFLELASLLERVDSSTTHYQALGLNRSASREEIDASYRQMLSLFFPEYSVGAVLPSDLITRLDNAFKKASLAFSVLASFSRRRAYDPREAEPAKAPPADSVRTPGPAEPNSEPASRDEDEIRMPQQTSQSRVYRESGRTVAPDNRRRCERMRLSLPARVTGFDRNKGKWNEMTETVDVDRTGLTLRVRRRVKFGNVLYLTLPLPTKLRTHGYSVPHYSVYALVRRVDPPSDGIWLASLEFLGEHPPAGFLDKPWAVFRTRKWNGSERRRSPRIRRAERIRLEYFNEPMRLIATEEAETENVSRTGLRISVKAAPAEFDVVRIRSAARGFDGLAAPRNRFVGKDGIERLCVQFLDKEWPL